MKKKHIFHFISNKQNDEKTKKPKEKSLLITKINWKKLWYVHNVHSTQFRKHKSKTNVTFHFIILITILFFFLFHNFVHFFMKFANKRKIYELENATKYGFMCFNI
jgi:hypothetical protein